MSFIIKAFDNRSGLTYFYECQNYWDKEKKRSCSKRKLIGKLDPNTGEMISTDGRGQKRNSREERKHKMDIKKEQRMTREEAIQILKDWDGYFIGHGSDDVNEALNMAIETLETTLCIKEKCAYCPHCKNCDVDDETLAIKALEQEPKTGHWIWDTSKLGDRCYCSECGYYRQLQVSEPDNYCPNCGVRMVESEGKNADSN